MVKKGKYEYCHLFSSSNFDHSGTIQRPMRPQMTLFLLICSIIVAPNENKSHQEQLFTAKLMQP